MNGLACSVAKTSAAGTPIKQSEPTSEVPGLKQDEEFEDYHLKLEFKWGDDGRYYYNPAAEAFNYNLRVLRSSTAIL